MSNGHSVAHKKGEHAIFRSCKRREADFETAHFRLNTLARPACGCAHQPHSRNPGPWPIPIRQDAIPDWANGGMPGSDPLLIFVSAVSGATRQKTVRKRAWPKPGRFRYSVMKEDADVCGRRGSLWDLNCNLLLNKDLLTSGGGDCKRTALLIHCANPNRKMKGVQASRSEREGRTFTTRNVCRVSGFVHQCIT